jgi:hypothetical protein
MSGAKVVEIAKDIYSPASTAAFTRTVTGKTQGPCDYLVLSMNDYSREPNAGDDTDTGLNNGVDYVQVSLNSTKSGNQGDEGKVLYKFYGGGAVTDSAVYTGTINEVMRMLWRTNMGQKGLGATTQNSSRDVGVTYRLPLFKNEPCEVSVEISVLITTWYHAQANTHTTFTTSLKAHIVDACEDMKFAQTVKVGDVVASAENAPITIPDRPGYYFVGYAISAYDNSVSVGLDLLGGMANADNTDCTGWVQVRNSDGQIFDFADGMQLKNDITALAGPHELYAAARLWSDSLYGLGDYARLMASPIEARSLVLLLSPNALAAAADRFRIYFFYVTQRGRSVDTNRTQPQSVKAGSEGVVTAQASA